MGLGSYFKADAPGSGGAGNGAGAGAGAGGAGAGGNSRQHGRGASNGGNKARNTAASSISEKMDHDLAPPPKLGNSRPQSISGRSTRSLSSSMFLDDIKHEVMVNYLYQQQCSHLWVSDGSGEIEGVLLRKARGQYMACPPQLGNSPFAMACAALNVQVSWNPCVLLRIE